MLIVQKRTDGEGDNRSDAAHKVNDPVRPRPLRIRGNVRHKRHGRRAEQAHGQVHGNGKNKQQPQRVVKRNETHKHRRQRHANEQIGHSAAEPRVCPVAAPSDPRLNEQSEIVVDRHNKSD